MTCAVKGGGRLKCWGSDIDGSVAGPNVSADSFGFPPAQIAQLKRTIDAFALRNSLPTTFNKYLDKAATDYANLDRSGVCSNLAKIRKLANDERGHRLTPQQTGQILLTLDGINASIGGCI